MKKLTLLAMVLLIAVLVGIRQELSTIAQGSGGKTAAVRTDACGDVNGDDTADIGDAVFLLNWLFGDGPEPPVCAASANGEEVETVSLDLRKCIGQVTNSASVEFRVPEGRILLIEDLTVSIVNCLGDEGQPIPKGTLAARVDGQQIGNLTQRYGGDGAFEGRYFSRRTQIYAEGPTLIDVRLEPAEFVGGIFVRGHGRLLHGTRTVIRN